MSSLTAAKQNSGTVQGEEDWISVSDLMSALMMIFLLLAMFYLIYLDEDKKLQAMDQEILITEKGELEAKLTGAEKMIADQAEMLSKAQSENKALFDRTGDLEKELLSSQKLIAEQDKLLSESRNKLEVISKLQSENKALFDKKGDLEAKLASSKQMIAEQAQALIKSEEKIALLKRESEEKAKRIDTAVAEAVIYDDVIKELRQSLLGEFNADLKKWNAELRDDLTFRFNEPTTLFSIGDATIKPKFKNILADFFPRYLKVITSDKFKKDIAEVRIEGHTSSVWGDLEPNSREAYNLNMELSQNRSRNTLFYVMGLESADEHRSWLRSRLTANGLSSSKLVDANGYYLTDKRSDGIENLANSQRAEFRVRIDAESKITKIIDSKKTKSDSE